MSMKLNCNCLKDEEKVPYGYMTHLNDIFINSCCGGCVALRLLVYCPFCGGKLYD